jgi:tetratricopeptide (TPR) repeat protein
MLKQAALVLEQIGQPDAAEGLYLDYVARSGRPEAVLALAQYQARNGQHEDALSLCKAHWDKLPPAVVARTAVGLLRHGRLGEPHTTEVGVRIEEAIAEAQDSTRQLELLTLLADLRDLQGDYSAAEAVYREILKLSPSHLTALNNLAWLSARRGQTANALELIDLAIAQFGPYPELLDTKGVVLLESGQGAAAVRVLTEAIASRPMAEIYLHLAEAEWKAGNRAAARKAFDKAVELGLKPDELHVLDRAQYDMLSSHLAKS